ncbi:MAG: DNA-binding protein [Chthoniobacteraceae bacterium]
MDQTLASQELQVERKHIIIEFRENDRGRFLRLTEEAHGRRNTVIIPSTGVTEFARLLDQVLTDGGHFAADPKTPV